MPGLECPAAACMGGVEEARFVTVESADVATMMELLKLHTAICPAYLTALPGVVTVKAPSLDRPVVEAGISEEEWNVFEQKWGLFKGGARLAGAQIAPQLYNCCEPSLQSSLLKENDKFAQMTERDALTAIKNLAVVPVAICVRRASLLAMTQDSGESAREYYARIKGRADTCSYKSKCTCSLEVDFTEIIIKDVFVSGISDNEIRENVLGWTELDCSDMAATIKYVEGKETARNAVSMDRGSVNASGFQRRKSESRPVRSDKDEDRDVEQKLKLTAKCPECRSEFHQYKRMGKSVNKRPFKLCKPCFDKEKAAGNITSFSIIGGVRASLVNKGRGSNRRLGDNLVLPRDIQIPLEHQTFDGLQWRKAVREDHPKINVRLEICANDYTSHGMSPPASSVHIMESVTDTGAQVPLFPRKSLSKIGLTRHDLFRVQHKIYAANRSPIDIDGAFFAKVGGNSPTGNSTRAMIFVSPDATGFFLSKKLLKELDILPHNFPTFPSPQNDVIAGVKKG